MNSKAHFVTSVAGLSLVKPSASMLSLARVMVGGYKSVVTGHLVARLRHLKSVETRAATVRT